MIGALETALMEIKESFIMAFAALRTNKLRSVLTLLGIAVGVFSIIAVMTAMGALVDGIENGLSELGAHTFQVQKRPITRPSNARDRAKIRARKDITYEQGLAVRDKATFAAAVGIESWTFGKVAVSPTGTKTNPNVSLAGENLEGFVTNSWTIGDGRLFTQEELNSARNVVVIAMGVKDKLFPHVDPINETIRFDGI